MAGGMFAGHDQSGGDIVEENGKKFKMFYGMSSATAMDVSLNNVADRINSGILKMGFDFKFQKRDLI
jgi:IMP dehydrogenase/GMP reductase